MKSRINLKSLIVLVVALFALTAVVGLAMAAPGAVDTDPAEVDEDDEPDTWIEDGEVLDEQFNATGDTSYGLAVDLSDETELPEEDDLEMNVTHEEYEKYEFTGEWTWYDAEEEDDGLFHTFSDDELDRVPVTPEDTVELNVSYWDVNDEDEDGEIAEEDITTVTVELETTDERYVQNLQNDSAAVTVSEESPPMYRPFADDYDAATIEDTAEVAGEDTTVTYNLDDSELTDVYDDATEDISTSGAFTLMQVEVDGDTVPVYYNEKPDEFEIADDGAYVAYEPGADQIHVHGVDADGDVDVMVNSDPFRVFDIGAVWDLEGFDGVISLVMG